jgi:hypothetical protein
MAVIATAFLTEGELARAVQVTLEDARVRESLRGAGLGQGAKLLVYVVPMEWRLPDLPLEDVRGRAHAGGHRTPGGFDRHRYRVLFTKARTHAPASRGREIVTRTYGRDPVLLARIDLRTAAVTGIETPPAHVWWGDIPTPLF